MDKNKITIIGIAGGTGSGKTTVVRKIVEALPPHFVAVVPLDSYYNDTTGMTDEERHAINFDHPDAFDWKLLHKQINDLREGKPIEQPTYSYIKCNRLPETVHVEPKPVIIIEGIMTLLNKKIRIGVRNLGHDCFAQINSELALFGVNIAEHDILVIIFFFESADHNRLNALAHGVNRNPRVLAEQLYRLKKFLVIHFPNQSFRP